MSPIKYLIIIIFTILTIPLMAQEKSGSFPDFKLSENTSVSSGNDLPFWMVTNQNGVFALHNSSYLLLQTGINRVLERDTLKKWGYTYGANPALAHSRQVKVMLLLNYHNANVLEGTV